MTVNRAGVYWFDDNQGIDLPASCQVQFWTGSAWQNASGASACGVAANTFNTVTFTAVATTQLRLNITTDVNVLSGPTDWSAPASIVD